MIRKGTYAVFMSFDEDVGVNIGSLGPVVLKSGEYCYIGSAMGGLDQRIERHLSKSKSMHWHIDRLTVVADRMEVYESFPDYVQECMLSSMAGKAGCMPMLKGFGCSDCRCETHLFMVDTSSKRRFIASAGLVRYTKSGPVK